MTVRPSPIRTVARVLVLGILGSGCASKGPCVTAAARSASIDVESGVPSDRDEVRRLLAGAGPRRQCQLVILPGLWAGAHAVWIEEDLTNGVGGGVRVRSLANTGEVASFSGPLDARALKSLSLLCQQVIATLRRSCTELVRDGTWYYATHPSLAGGYETATFVSPKRGSLGDAFVTTMEALVDYATAPPSLKMGHWMRVELMQSDLEERLGRHQQR